MKNFQCGQTLINFPHEAFHEDDFRQADGQASEAARKRVHIVEVMQLHGVRKVEGEIFQIGAAVCDLVKNGRGDEFGGEFDVSKSTGESDADDTHEGVRIADVETWIFRTEGDTGPETSVVGEEPPFFADERDLAEIDKAEVPENRQEDVVGKILDRFLRK